MKVSPRGNGGPGERPGRRAEENGGVEKGAGDPHEPEKKGKEIAGLGELEKQWRE